MEIYLIRHTTPDIGKGICYGQSDIPLIKGYLKEFKAVKKQIHNEKITTYSSPLIRCSKLATYLSDKVISDHRLKELHFGDWELKPWEAIPNKELAPWMKDFVNVQVPEGESYTDLYDRSVAFLNEIVQKNESCLVVTHAGVARAILAYLMNIPLKDSFSIKIDYGAVFQLKREKDKLSVASKIIFKPF